MNVPMRASRPRAEEIYRADELVPPPGTPARNARTGCSRPMAMLKMGFARVNRLAVAPRPSGPLDSVMPQGNVQLAVVFRPVAVRSHHRLR